MIMPWFRMYSEFAADPKVQLLAFEDQRHYVLLLCLKCNGTLDTEAVSGPHFERLVCKALGVDPATGSEVKRRLIEVGLIDKKWQPVKWDSRQYESDSSTQRVRKHREKHNETFQKRFSNGDVTDKRRGDKNRTEEMSSSSTDVELVFDHWKKTFNHPRAVLDSKRRKVIAAALVLYPQATLTTALTGYRRSKWHMGENDRRKVFDDLDLLLRDAKHIEAGMELADKPAAEFEGMKWT